MIITPKRKVTDLLPSEAILISNDFERDVILQLMEDAGMDWADGEKATNWNPIQVGYKYPFVLFNHPHDIGCIAFRAFGDQINILPILNATDFLVGAVSGCASSVNKMFMRLPFVLDWVEYKGETVVAQINYEATIKAKKPMIDISYCMTKALNQVILFTCQYDKNKFKPSHLGMAKW